MSVTVPCLCQPRSDGSPSHPAGDTITLRERLDFTGALAAKHAVTLLKTNDPESSAADVLAVLTEHYVLHGIASWTLVDEQGKPLPVTKPAIRERVLLNDEAAYAIADEADDLYTGQVLLPLVARASKSSPPSPTPDSTSQPTGSEPTPLTRSSRSSTGNSPTDDTATTTGRPAGGSRSSQNSESDA